jgi:hypothetical protein
MYRYAAQPAFLCRHDPLNILNTSSVSVLFNPALQMRFYFEDLFVSRSQNSGKGSVKPILASVGGWHFG